MSKWTKDAIEAPHTQRWMGGGGDGVWLPIETAPKDGTEVLVFQPDNVPGLRWGGMSGIFIAYFRDSGLFHAASWVDHGQGDECAPTHWQPLPEPPK